MSETELKFKVWWIPQVPMKRFEVEVDSIEEGRKLCDVLARYDQFQYENNVKPDYCNAGGLIFMHPVITDGEWEDVPDDDEKWELVYADAKALADLKDAKTKFQTALRNIVGKIEKTDPSDPEANQRLVTEIYISVRDELGYN